MATGAQQMHQRLNAPRCSNGVAMLNAAMSQASKGDRRLRTLHLRATAQLAQTGLDEVWDAAHGKEGACSQWGAKAGAVWLPEH